MNDCKNVCIVNKDRKINVQNYVLCRMMLADASFGTYASTGYVFDLFYNFHISSLLFQYFVLTTDRLVHNFKKVACLPYSLKLCI